MKYAGDVVHVTDVCVIPTLWECGRVVFCGLINGSPLCHRPLLISAVALLEAVDKLLLVLMIQVSAVILKVCRIVVSLPRIAIHL